LAVVLLGLVPSAVPAAAHQAVPAARTSARRADLGVGLGYLRSRPDLVALAATAAANNLAYAMCLTVLPLWAVAPGRLDLSASGYGLLLSCLAIGSIAAGPLTPMVRRSMGERPLLRFGGPLLGFCYLAIAATTVWVVAAAFVVYGLV